MRNWRQTVQSEFWNSPTLTALLDSLEEWFSPDANFENFYTFVLNVDTAVGHGLDVLGRIVGVTRVLNIGDIELSYFGWGEAGDRTGWNQSPWYSQPVTDNVTLADDVFRMLILAKAAYNITNGSIPAINAILMNLFPGRGNAYVTDGRNAPPGAWFGWGEAGDRETWGNGSWSDDLVLPNPMTMVYVFDFQLQPFEIAMVTQSGALPKPTGVLATVSYVT